MEEIIHFEINNWFPGRDFPDDEIFHKWISNYQFRDDEWCKQNKLCVMCGPIDMSMNYCVAAPKSWVEEHCPKLLTDEEFVYKLATTHYDKDGNEIYDIKEYTKKYSDFICQADEDGYAYGHISEWEFPEYKEENFGVTWNDSWWEGMDNEEDDEDDD